MRTITLHHHDGTYPITTRQSGSIFVELHDDIIKQGRNRCWIGNREGHIIHLLETRPERERVHLLSEAPCRCVAKSLRADLFVVDVERGSSDGARGGWPSESLSCADSTGETSFPSSALQSVNYHIYGSRTDMCQCRK